MANSNGWGDGASNNSIGWGQGSNNATGWGSSQATSWSGLTNIVGTSLDADASAFITAAAITDATQQSAIDTLVTGLKTDGIWTKMKAIYPFVGGTATTHKFNLKDPRDLDAAFRLVFTGGWTHSSNGALPNGTNAFADTKLIPSSILTSNSAHLSYYSRTNTTNANCVIGAVQPALNNLRLIPNLGGAEYVENNALSFGRVKTTVNSLGLFITSRIISTEYKYYKDSTQSGATLISSSVTPPSNTVYISAQNNLGAAALYSPCQTAFSTIGDGLSNTDAANLYTRVQAFQTTLSRQV